MHTEIIIIAPSFQNIIGEKGRRLRELTNVVQKRFKVPELYAQKVSNRIFSAQLLRLSISEANFSFTACIPTWFSEYVHKLVVLSFMAEETSLKFWSLINVLKVPGHDKV
ncbi:small ribosomal subunit protein uS3y-like [Apium graveolens]|uniref:small ribosomal subunit protein uS3y-like n=1 Tax=Apium graveolens TaxID=4045 RepID=UPI003D7BE554